MATRKKNFPQPGEATDQNPVVWRSTDDIIQIANDMNGWTYSTLSETVQDWTRGHGIKLGWSRVEFPLAYPSRTARAGVTFIK